MTFAPTAREYGISRLTVTGAAGIGSTNVVATHQGGGSWPNAHIDGTSFTVTVTGQAVLSGGTPTLGLALVEDSTDVAGDFTNAAGTALSAGVLGYIPLGLVNSIDGTYTFGGGGALTPAVNKGGTYRLVLTVGNAADSARNASSVDTGATSPDYHSDSDGTDARGALGTNQTSGRNIGGCGHRLVLTARSGHTGNKKYRDTMALALSLRPTNATSSTLISPKEIKAGHRTVNTDGAAVKLVRGTPNTTGDVTLNYPIDRDFGEVIGGTDYFTHIGVNNTLGDATTPANETAGIWSTGTIVGVTTAQRAAFLFSSTGHVSGMTAADANRLVSSTADTKASAAIQLFKDAARTVAGVGAFATSAYALAQNIFKRTGAVNTTNAVPYLEAYIADAYGAALASLASAFSAATQRMFDSVAVDTQTLSTDANGRTRWNFTVPATAAAYSPYVKIGTARQAGSHVATGPDISVPATFALGNGDYAGPFPGYGRKVVMTGTGFSAGKEPSDTENNVFGVNSQWPPEDLWSGPLTSAQLDANGVPNGPGSRQQTLGAGSLKTKPSSLVNEGTGRVISLTDSCVKDVAGRDIDLSGAESIFLRRALFNDTSDTVEDAGTNLTDGQTSLDTNAQFGYHSGNNSLDTVAAPVDGASFKYYLAGADTSTQRTSFALTVSGADPVAGFTADVGNFGYFEQILSFASADLTLKLLLNCEVAQSDPTVPRRFTIKVMRRTQDNTFADAAPDSAPLVAVFAQGTTGALQILEYVVPTPIGAAPTPNWEFTHAPPIGYTSVKYCAMAKVSGSDTPSGSEATVQIGYEYDATGSLIRILQSA